MLSKEDEGVFGEREQRKRRREKGSIGGYSQRGRLKWIHFVRMTQDEQVQNEWGKILEAMDNLADLKRKLLVKNFHWELTRTSDRIHILWIFFLHFLLFSSIFLCNSFGTERQIHQGFFFWMIIHQVIIVRQFVNQKNSTSIANRFGLKIISNEMIQYRRMIFVQIQFFSEFHSLALFFNTLYFATHPPFVLNDPNIFSFIFLDAISMEKYDNEAMLFTFSLFFFLSSKYIQKRFSIHESHHLSLNPNAVIKETQISYAVVICDYFLISEWYLIVEQWCSEWDSMYEIETEMCVLCVVWAKV